MIASRSMNPAELTDIGLAGVSPMGAQNQSLAQQQVIQPAARAIVSATTAQPNNFGEYNSPKMNTDNKINEIRNQALAIEAEQRAEQRAAVERELYSQQNNNGLAYNNNNNLTGLDRHKQYEGFRNKVYKDTEGHDTVGYGHKLTKDDIASGRYAKGISQQDADMLLQRDVNKHNQGLYNRNPWVSQQPQNVRTALEDMSYNMGSMQAWPETMDAIKQGNYSLAAQNIENSKYATQVGNRAINNARLIRGQ